MNEVIKLILSLSLSGSILAGIIFAIKPLIKNRFSKGIQYYLWIVVLLRLLLPFSFEGSVMNKVFSKEAPSGNIPYHSRVDTKKSKAEVDITLSAPVNVKENKSTSIIQPAALKSLKLKDAFNQYSLYIWLLGTLIAFIINMLGYKKFIRKLRETNKPAAAEEITIFQTLLESKNVVGLVRNSYVTTPMLIGIVEPMIVIPDNEFTKEQLKNILMHEIVHYKHFDIPVKWILMVAASLHWFNPLMYFIRKEVNHACELACDEVVIKNLKPSEKQCYGDTLISIAAENKFPIGVLQATMSEEKRTLKDRLISIMNYGKKSKLVIAFSVILLGIIVVSALYLGAGSSLEIGKSTPPQVYINVEYMKTKSAITGSYQWKSWGTHTIADADHPVNFQYGEDNIISVGKEEQLILSTEKLRKDKAYDFTVEQLDVYKEGRLVEFQSVEPSFTNGSLYIQAPAEAGEYIYSLHLNFKDKGTVNYGFIVRVDMMTYNLAEISKYKTPYVGDASKVGQIVGRLPAPDSNFRSQYISLETDEKPYGITAYYEAKENGTQIVADPGSSIYSNMQMNALVLFSMIDNVDNVTFAFRDSQSGDKLEEEKYKTAFNFSRASIAEKFGDINKMSKDLELLKDKLEGKASAFKGLELYVWRNPELTGNNNVYYNLLIGTNRSKTEEEIYNLNTSTSELKVIKQALSGYQSDTQVLVSHSVDIDKETMAKIAEELSFGIKSGNISIGAFENTRE